MRPASFASRGGRVCNKVELGVRAGRSRVRQSVGPSRARRSDDARLQEALGLRDDGWRIRRSFGMFWKATETRMRFQVQHHGTVASTSETAFEALRERLARHGDVHVAQTQTRGRGRLGRSWHSEPGTGLYMSVVLLPERVLSPAGLTMAAGLAVRDVVLALGLNSARLKWPNDVVVPIAAGEAKLAGILVETRGLDPEHPHYVVGIGVNVAQASFPPELLAERPVASLRTCGITTDVGGVLAELLPTLARRLDQITLEPKQLARDFVEALGLSTGRVLVVQGEVAILGRLVSFDVDAGLVITADDGRQHVVPLEIVRELRSAR